MAATSTPIHRSLPAAVIASLVLGLTVGAAIRPLLTSPVMMWSVDILDVIGTMWVSAIRMTVIPLIVPLIIGAIANASSGRAVGRLGIATFAAFLGMVMILAALSAVTSPLLFRGLHLDPDATAGMRASASTSALPSGDASLAGWFKELIPTNPIRAAADGTMLSVIVFAGAFGFATRGAPQELRARVLRSTETLGGVMMVMVQAVLLLAPLGVFALAFVVGARVGVVAFRALGYFVGLQALSQVFFLAALFAIVVFVGRLSPRQAWRGAAPALFVAAGSSSSLSALPAMIEGARDEWEIPEETYGFVLPLAVSTFKPTSASAWVFDAYFVALLYGIPFGPTALALTAIYAVLLNATVPGIPGGGIIVMSPMFLAVGLPLEALAIILAVNPITDRFLTVGNVAADMTVTAILARWKPPSLAKVG